MNGIHYGIGGQKLDAWCSEVILLHLATCIIQVLYHHA